ncbi:MAG: BON domain-containing protein [Acidobacteriia bacterium]|nr:BON domain-containing protein [Terriglobia bacterium]
MVPKAITATRGRKLVLAIVLCFLAVPMVAVAEPATTPTPAQGPAARAGGSIDHAWGQVSASVGEALLMTRVRVALLERLKEDGLRVTIEAHGGNIELSGQVERSANVQLAERVAASVDGVRTVHSSVTLAANGQALEPPVAHILGKVERGFADVLLEARVKVRLLSELGKVAFEVEVDAARGVVTLKGTVPDADRRKLATGIVRSTSGVKEVRDQLTVKE